MSEQGLPGDVVESAATVLSEHFGAAVQITDHDVLRDGRSKVARLSLGAGAPVGTAILKLSGEHRELLWNEYAGLAFMAGLPEPTTAVPRLYGGDRELGFVIMEDYGDEHSLADVLLRGDAKAARQAMFGYVDALLAVHLATFDHTEAFTSLRESFSPGGGRQSQSVEETWETLTGRLAELDAGLDAGQAVIAKDWIAAQLEEPSGWHAFTVNDCCPDNNQVDASGRVRLFDLEFCHIRHALIDLGYVRTTMPTCWCLRRFPTGLDDDLVAHYRERLLAARPDLSHDGFEPSLAAAEAYLALVNLSWHLDRAAGPGGSEAHYIEQRDFHLPNRRQMVLLRLDELTRTADRQPELEPLGKLAGQIRQAARREWGLVEPIPIYPAFS